MFNLLNAVVDTPTSNFSGNSANITTKSEQSEFIFLLIIVFLAGIFTHYIYIKIKECLKEDAEKTKKDEENKENDKKGE